MARILILYSTVEGQTARIAARIAEHLRGLAHAVAVQDAAAARDLAGYDAVIVGASVHYGRHPAALAAKLRRHGAVLQGKPGAFFSVSLSAGGPGANRPAAARYLEKFLRQAHWRPRHVAAFGGALRYSEYGRCKRFLVKLFVRIAGGDTDHARDYEYTDWNAVAQFAEGFGESLPRA